MVDLETRRLSVFEASLRVDGMTRRLMQNGPAQFFKKTDSTLRGPISAEFGALLGLFPDNSIVFALGHPSQGRVVKGSVL